VGLLESIISQIRSIFRPGMVVCDAETNETNEANDVNEKNSKKNKKEERKGAVVKKDKTPVENA